MSGVSYFIKGIGFILRAILLTPLRLIYRWLLSSVLSRVYLSVYFPIKRRLVERFGFSKKTIWYPFLTKYVIHVLILVIAVSVLVHSIETRTVSAEEFGNDSLITKLLGGESDVLITETAEDILLAPSNYQDQRGLVGNPMAVSEGTDAESEDEEDQTLAFAQGGGSILKPNIPTTDVGDRAREQVEYYVVQAGDTVSTIAEQFDVSTNTILWENKLGESDYIKPGDKLTVLPMSGVSHQVKKDDTISSIAKKYDVEENEIIEYNKLASADAIAVDEILIIPGGRAPEIVRPTTTNTVEKYFTGTAPPPARVDPSDKLLWPTPSHKINQYYTWRHHGIDIDGDYSSPVYAADSGTIVNVGWGTGYGLHVIIDHGGGKKTVYAHFSQAFVSAGQYVNKGDTLGMQGCTGWCTGTHLHFEVIINGSKVNPLSYL